MDLMYVDFTCLTIVYAVHCGEEKAALKECGKLKAIHGGMQLHCLIFKHGFDRDNFLMTSLLHLYSKCGFIEKAHQVFAEMPQRDVVAANSMIYGLCHSNQTAEAINLFDRMEAKDVGSWNSLISGLACNSEGRRCGLILFERMRLEGVKFDIMTMVSVLSICANLAALVNGEKVHGLVIKNGLDPFLPIGNAIIDMYAKCGLMENAYHCFQSMPLRNVISWTSLVSGYGKNGLGVKAIEAFESMQKEGILPNKITFLAILYACSHAGLVQQGRSYFNTMIHNHSINPMMEHYTCMVDLLARSGQFDEAHEFMSKMPLKPDVKLLTAFLSSCFYHKNIELSLHAARKLIQLEPEEAGAYMLLSNLYGLVGDLENVAKVRKLMLDKGIRKVKASTWIEIDREVHVFQSGDRSHPMSEEIYIFWGKFVGKMKEVGGYVPDTSMVMQNVEEGMKEEMVLSHSEKLAVGFGLMMTSEGSRIMIVKNLRVCVDCHFVMKLISKIEGRAIVARDSSRFHHFRHGVCSCGDRW